jgi:rfaE bifunctional protein kinase chain/domain
MADLKHTISRVFPQKTVAIIGDLVADQFLNGTIQRVSREAPVFIMRHDTTVTLPGAAANAAANVASLGGKPILIGLAGTDANAERLAEALDKCGVDRDRVVSTPAFTTTTKVRVLAGQHYAARQQVIRIDYENSTGITDEVANRLRQNLVDAADRADAIIVSDYGYGAVYTVLFEDARIISRERQIPLIVDSRYRLGEFTGATTATPNREEVEHILGQGFTPDDCTALRERLDYEALLITNGNQGMTLLEKDKPALNLAAVGPAEPVDVTGAGDTVIAAYALGLASGLDFAEAAAVANHAGGLVVMKKGTATVTGQELSASLGLETTSLVEKHAG